MTSSQRSWKCCETVPTIFRRASFPNCLIICPIFAQFTRLSLSSLPGANQVVPGPKHVRRQCPGLEFLCGLRTSIGELTTQYIPSWDYHSKLWHELFYNRCPSCLRAIPLGNKQWKPFFTFCWPFILLFLAMNGHSMIPE